ncbi:MAG: AAA family ATPase [Armatimonadetes bacterium]|nr:AAA family ATPase [Armatimonadota bacterium]MDE2207624.1 AAA family ATPase [Armatimonadota bacterium]
MNRVIAVVGMTGSGKSLLCRELARRGCPVIYFGGIVLHEVQARGLALTPENERRVREELRAAEGMDVCAVRALPEIHELLEANRNVVVDGLYSFSEYRTLYAALGGRLIVAAVCSPRAMRYRRLAERPERPLTAAEAEARDIAEIEKIEKGGPIAMADITFLNDAGPEQMADAADRLIAIALSEA